MFLRKSVLLAVVVMALSLMPSLATGATTLNSLAASPDPVEDTSITLTVTGQADAGMRLFMFWSSYAGCVYTPSSGMTGEVGPSSGRPLPTGAFTETFTVSPTDAGTYYACAIVSTSYYYTGPAKERTTVVVRRPTATIDGFTVSTPREKAQPVTITVTGTSEIRRKLFVYFTNFQWCSTSPTGNLGDLNESGTGVGPGPFSVSVSATPREYGTWYICALVAESPYQYLAAEARGQTTFDVPRPPLPPPTVDLAGCYPRPAPATGLNVTVGDDRLATLRWSSPGSTNDSVFLKRDGRLVAKVTSEGFSEFDDGDFMLPRKAGAVTDAGAGQRVAALRDPLPPGTYSWKVRRAALPTKECTRPYEADTPEETFQITASPLDVLHVRTQADWGSSLADPGQTRLIITTTPYANVRIALTRRGTTEKADYVWGDDAREVHSVHWSCPMRGPRSMSYRVTA